MLKRSLLKILFTLCTVQAVPAYADSELRYLYRGARMTAMGGASIAVADDSQMIFSNPAGLAQFNRYEVRYLGIDVEGSLDILYAYKDGSDAFQKATISNFNQIMGHNIYFRGTGTSTLLIPGFGFTLLGDIQGAFYAKNKALPRFTFGYQQTNGIQLATGFQLYGSRKKSTKPRPSLSLGIGAKALFRKGGFFNVATVDLLSLTEGTAAISPIVGEYGLGLGADFGLLLNQPLSRTALLSIGTSYTDIGNTSFPGKADPVMENLGVGFALKKNFGFLKGILAYDYTNITAGDVDWRKKNHVGLELAIPRFSLMGGVNQAYFSGGAKFDLEFMEITASSYSTELGALVQQDPSRRFIIRMDLKFDL